MSSSGRELKTKLESLSQLKDDKMVPWFQKKPRGGAWKQIQMKLKGDHEHPLIKIVRNKNFAVYGIIHAELGGAGESCPVSFLVL